MQVGHGQPGLSSVTMTEGHGLLTGIVCIIHNVSSPEREIKHSDIGQK